MKIATKIARQPDGTYRGWCPGLPGCIIYGVSEKQAKRRIKEAVYGYLASLEVALPRELHRLAVTG